MLSRRESAVHFRDAISRGRGAVSLTHTGRARGEEQLGRISYDSLRTAEQKTSAPISQPASALPV